MVVVPLDEVVDGGVAVSRTRARGAAGQPLLCEAGEEDLVAPLALEEDVLQEVGLAAEAEAVEEVMGSGVAGVGEGGDSMFAEGAEEVIEEGCHGLSHEAAALEGAGEGEAELDLAAVVLEVKGAVAHEGIGGGVGEGDLGPGARRVEGGCLEAAQEDAGVVQGEGRGPALVARDLGVGSVVGEGREVGLAEGTQDGARGAKDEAHGGRGG